MNQFTLRGIPEEIEKMVKKEAGKKGWSLNRAFIALLEKAAGTRKKKINPKAEYHDLDHLAGAWSKEEARVFDKHLQQQRKVDEKLWKT